MSPLYLIKLKIAQKQPTAYCSIQLNRLFKNFTESLTEETHRVYCSMSSYSTRTKRCVAEEVSCTTDFADWRSSSSWRGNAGNV